MGRDGGVVTGGRLKPLAQVAGLQYNLLAVATGDGMLNDDVPGLSEQWNYLVHCRQRRNDR